MAQPTQARLAFGPDGSTPAQPATLTSVTDSRMEIRYLDGTVGVVTAADRDRLVQILGRDDLCRLRGNPLLLVNTRYRLVGIATGPPTPPSSLVVTLVSRIEDGAAVELMSDDDSQPAWQLVDLVAERRKSRP
jgi:hypothetical protein